MKNRCYVLCILYCLCLTASGYPEEFNKEGHWIVVTPSSLRQNIDPLCQYRKQEGFDVLVVETEDIYKQTENRVDKAQAIQKFLHTKYTDLEGDIYVVLVGSVLPLTQDGPSLLPLPGTLGRMKSLASDTGYGLEVPEKTKTVMVGRLPAQNSSELTAMVNKILKFEQTSLPGPWNYRLSLVAGNPGGRTLAEKNFSGMFLRMIGQECVSRIHPFWCLEGLIHVKGSGFYVPDDQLNSYSKELFQKGQVFSFYLGHSSPVELGSDGISFMNQADWKSLSISNLQGVFFTCGCYACWITQPDKPDGYALTAIRNPNGPDAVIGPLGESYAAIGQLAFDGILQCMSLSEPPARLGYYWKSVQNGIASGQMKPMTFMLYDYADGSGGTTTLDFQRREHLQMWMLLGDPATKVPTPSKEIELEVMGPALPGQTIQCKGKVSDNFNEATITLTLERTLKKTQAPSGTQQAEGYVRDRIVDKIEIQADKGVFFGELELPEKLPFVDMALRAYAVKGNDDAMCVQLIKVGPDSISQKSP